MYFPIVIQLLFDKRSSIIVFAFSILKRKQLLCDSFFRNSLDLSVFILLTMNSILSGNTCGILIVKYRKLIHESNHKMMWRYLKHSNFLIFTIKRSEENCLKLI